MIYEILHASADVLALLMPLFESFETAELTLPNGETIRPAAGFHTVVTDNHPPEHLPEALQDRFTCLLRVERPHPRAYDRLDDWLREAAEAGEAIESGRRISARGWLNLQQLIPVFGLFDACRVAFGPDRGREVYNALTLRRALGRTDG